MTFNQEYDREFVMGEGKWRDHVPQDVIPVAENDTHVKIALIDEVPTDTVHAEKEALHKQEWSSVEEFREDVEWERDE